LNSGNRSKDGVVDGRAQDRVSRTVEPNCSGASGRSLTNGFHLASGLRHGSQATQRVHVDGKFFAADSQRFPFRGVT
jgi:hypothetical protein